MARCSDCGTERKHLHRHHIIPKSQGGSNDPDNLVSICANCHVRRHGGQAGGRLRGLNSNSLEANAKKSVASKAMWADPEWKAKTLASRAASKTPESERRRLERSTAAQRTPEGRAKRSEIATRLMEDPERRQRISESMKRVRQERSWSTRKKAD